MDNTQWEDEYQPADMDVESENEDEDDLVEKERLLYEEEEEDRMLDEEEQTREDFTARLEKYDEITVDLSDIKGVAANTAGEYERQVSSVSRPPKLIGCDEQHPHGNPALSDKKPLSYKSAEKWRSAFVWKFSRIAELGKTPWTYADDELWKGNPAKSSLISDYLQDLKRRKIIYNSSQTRAGNVSRSVKALNIDLLKKAYDWINDHERNDVQHFRENVHGRTKRPKKKTQSKPAAKPVKEEEDDSFRWHTPRILIQLWAMMLVAIICLLRPGEVLNLRWGDIVFAGPRDGLPYRMEIRLRYRKNDPYGEQCKDKTFVVYALPENRAYLCAVRALAHWIFVVPNSFRDATPDAYLFRKITRYDSVSDEPQTYTAFLEAFRCLLAEILENPSHYGVHTFRRMGAQLLFVYFKWHEKKIAEWGGWGLLNGLLVILGYLDGLRDNAGIRREDFLNPTLRPYTGSEMEGRPALIVNRHKYPFPLMRFENPDSSETPTLEAWIGPPKTFKDLIGLQLPEINPSHSKSSKTAPYSARSISATFLEFSYQDEGIADRLRAHYEVLIAGHEHDTFSTKTSDAWNGLRSVLRPPELNKSEDFVQDIAKALTKVLTHICSDIGKARGELKDVEVSYAGPPLGYSQKGDLSFHLRGKDLNDPTEGGICGATSEESKSEGVLKRCTPGLIADNTYSNEAHKDAKAILFKLYTHGLSINNDGSWVVHYGFVFTGRSCVLVQRGLKKLVALGFDQAGDGVHGLAVSPAYRVDGSTANVDLICLLVAMIYPPEQKQKILAPNQEQWSRLLPKVTQQRRTSQAKTQLTVVEQIVQTHDDSRRDGQGGAGGGGSMHEDPNGGTDSSKAGSSTSEGTQSVGNTPLGSSLALVVYPEASKPSIWPPWTWTVMGSRSWARLLSGKPPQSGAKYEMKDLDRSPEERSFTDKVISTAPTLILTSALSRGEFAMVFEGQLAHDKRKLSCVMKIYLTAYSFMAYKEVLAYHRLHALPAVPKLCGAFLALGSDYVGLLMEYKGRALGYDDWEELGLLPRERFTIYQIVQEIHRAGILHGDLAPRNVLRGSDGTLNLIDFGFSSLDHRCPGSTCAELLALAQSLHLDAHREEFFTASMKPNTANNSIVLNGL
ncbi:hypothetical protein R3P38DRAFT_2793888 [Favolaschia claudopus]|uniref:Protein kinase domain-containing protein n=1 Tax=Favolaschia claudopus TaxID=2862362 RepID=A0AAW0ABC8_9AGAR